MIVKFVSLLLGPSAKLVFFVLGLAVVYPVSLSGADTPRQVEGEFEVEVEVEDAPPPATGNAERPAPGQNYSLPCLAPIVKSIDAEVPLTLDQALLSAPVRQLSQLREVGADAIDFPITTSDEKVQRLFHQGIALLHSFWYQEARRAFREAHSLEPNNPMLLWGLALANERRPERARMYAHRAQVLLKGAISNRERLWLQEQANYFAINRETPLAESPAQERDSEFVEARSRQRVRDLEKIATAFPEDLEARAFLIRELVVASYRSGVSPGSRLAVAEMAEDLLRRSPAHPAALYAILLWLDEQPQQAVKAAGKINTPGVPDAWRYAAQAYLESGRSAEAAELLGVALRVDHRYLFDSQQAPNQSQGLLDNHALLVRTLAGMGRVEEALDRARELARFPDSSAAMAAATSNRKAPLTGRRLGFDLYVRTLARVRLWERLRNDLDKVAELQPGQPVLANAHSIFWRAIADLHLDRAAGQQAAKQGQIRLIALKKNAGRSQTVAEETAQLEQALSLAIRLCSAVDDDSAVEAGDDSVGVLRKFLPGETVAELLADVGEMGEALKIISELHATRPADFLTTASYISLHHRADEKSKAMFAFDRNFRSHASLADEQLADLDQRLLPVASAMQLGRQWRLPAGKVELAFVPEDLDSIGPAIWQPVAAPAFQLKNEQGQKISLADYRGRPVLLNFFLGVGCVFCAEQFKLFAPHLKRFEQIGVEMVAISTDSLAVLQSALGSDQPAAAGIAANVPYAVLSDADREAFKAYGVIDDYGIGGMHATFLIDSRGRILWQDISRLPFEQPDALVAEAKRLLQLHAPSSPNPEDSPP